MKSTTGLSLAAAGAVLAFAVHGHLSFLNFNAAGWVVMLAGIAGLLIRPETRRRLRQRLIMRDGTYEPAFEAGDTEYSAALRPAGLLGPDEHDVPAEGTALEEQVVPE